VDRGRFVVAAVAAVALCATPRASADIIAAVDVPFEAPTGASSNASRHPDQFDVALLNATTGARFSLPAGVDTTSADEFHPSLTPDGKWLAFERVDPIAGTTRIIAANLTTGQMADLFNTFEMSTLQPATPFVEPDGSTVVTGTRYSFMPQRTSTSLGAFPVGPFTHAQTEFVITEADGRTLDPVDAGSVSGATVVDSATGSEGVVLQAQNGTETSVVFIAPSFDASASIGFAHPAISDPTTTDVAVMERRTTGSCTAVPQCPVLAQLGFVSRAGDVAGNPFNLPAIVNAPGLDEAFPAFTPDGRYLGFVRQTADDHDRLFVFDTVTQTLLNAHGVDLGLLGAPLSPRDRLRRLQGNLSLRETVVLTPLFQLLSSGQLQFHLLTSTGVGLLVQRIVGHHQFLGHTVRTLKTVGRVPLGTFSRGKHTLHWNLRLAGRRLRPGTYLVTPRSVSARRIVTGLGTPRVLRVHQVLRARTSSPAARRERSPRRRWAANSIGSPPSGLRQALGAFGAERGSTSAASFRSQSRASIVASRGANRRQAGGRECQRCMRLSS
jgi:hypothetical protein